MAKQTKTIPRNEYLPNLLIYVGYQNTKQINNGPAILICIPMSKSCLCHLIQQIVGIQPLNSLLISTILYGSFMRSHNNRPCKYHPIYYYLYNNSQQLEIQNRIITLNLGIQMQINRYPTKPLISLSLRLPFHFFPKFVILELSI